MSTSVTPEPVAGGGQPPAPPAPAPKDGEQPLPAPKVDDPKPAPAPPAPPAPTVPEKYELQLPENAVIDSAVLDRTATIARELGLTNEHAQRLVVLANTEVQGALDALLADHAPGSGQAWKKQVETWEAEALADPQIGSKDKATLQRNAELAKRVAATFFPQPVLQFLGDSGYASHPDVIRGLLAIGKAMGEDKIVLPKDTSSGAPKGPMTEAEAARILFPTTSPKE